MPRTTGKFEIRWQKPVYESDESGLRATIEAVGPYTQLVAQRPSVGDAHKKLPPGYKILRVRVEGGRSTDGKMTIVAGRGGREGEDEDAQEPVYELDWGTETRQIEKHPSMPKLDPARPFYEFPDRAYSDTSNPRFETADAAGETSVSQRTLDDWQVLDAQDFPAIVGGWTAAQYRSLKEAGQDTYEVYFPIAKATTWHAERPSGVGSGIQDVSAPPTQTGAPASWLYVKTADRCQKEGERYRRTQEWEGRRGEDAAIFALVYG